ncbi:MAG: QueT transporter family protein [Evtepia gabavorous]
MTRTNTHLLALNGVIAAAYAALTYVAAAMNLAYGPVQFRVSEALTVLPFLFPGTWPGLFVGCLVANLMSPYGPLDILIGSAGTLLAAWLTQRTNHPWLAPLPPVLSCMVLTGGMLTWYEVGFSAQFPALFAANALWVGIGEGGGMLSAGHAASPGTSQGALPPALYSGSPPRACPGPKRVGSLHKW